MKFFISALIVLSSAAALAMPAVGDYAKYNLTVTSAGQTVAGTIEQQLLQSNAQGQYLEQSTATVTGQAPQVQQAWVNGSDLISDQTVAEIQQNCAAMGGQVQSVTVPAGSFSTCAVTSNDGSQTATYWIAAVPFGIVQADITDSSGAHTVAVLATYKAGN